MNTALVTSVKQTMDELQKLFSSFTQQQVDIVPFEGSWTAGQVAEHIIKSIGNLPAFFNSNTVTTNDRPFDGNVATLQHIFLDFSTKMQSPPFILPEATQHDKETILESFSNLKSQMITAAETLDLTLTCKSFEMPGIGYLTRFEWLHFFMVHTKRHTHQLGKIFAALNP
jgi:DinB superfamily